MKYFWLIFLTCLIVVTCRAQSADQITRLFSKWADPSKPGCVVGIVRHDSLIYAKGFGAADLEHPAPNTPESIYYMCSVSKQFTGYGIALLVSEGKLKLGDDVHRYLPWLADFGKPITIQNLLNHTSGLRDFINLAAIAGRPASGILDEQQALSLIARERTLNFEPGSKFSYSNTNYLLLAEIVRVVSGESFESFTAEHIFKPLHMTSSRFISDPREVIPNRAMSYENGRNSPQQTGGVGDGGLYSNMDDLARWAMHYYDPADSAVIRLMTIQGKLNSGKTITYAMGINSEHYHGWKRYIHNGSLAGYRTILVVYPELETGFILLGNGGDGSLYQKVDDLAALFVPDQRKPAAASPAVKRDSILANLPSPENTKSLAGDYIAENGYHLQFTVRDGRFWLNGKTLMQPAGRDTFKIFANPAVSYVFHNHATDLYSPVLDEPMHLLQCPATTFTEKQLAAYTGNYDCPEMGCSYGLVVKDGRLYWTSSIYPDTKVTLLGTDDLMSPDSELDHVHIRRDRKGQITGFELNSGEMMHLRFQKRP